MPLVSRPSLTPKKLAANRANAQLSRGPITPEGLIRMRDSKIKHGAYAQHREEALHALGEDPEDFECPMGVRPTEGVEKPPLCHARVGGGPGLDSRFRGNDGEGRFSREAPP